MHPESAPASDLVALLAGDAEMPLKARACQQLAVVGDAAAVPALAALLADARLGDYARCALENLPSPVAAEALRAALPTLRGSALAGAIDSLGVLCDGASVGPLAALALAQEAERAGRVAALGALGRIGDEAAAQALREALRGPDPEAAGQAVLVAARRLLDASKQEPALALLRALREVKPTPHLAEAAAALAWDAAALVLFDGESLAGWEGDPAWFRVHDRSIVAGSRTRPIPQNEFLVSAREFGDFELRLEVCLIGGQGNGGIQFRSQRVAGSREMIGYQADVGPGWWGGLYDESRRATLLGTRCAPEALAAVLRPAGWNDYRIRCVGKRVELRINGQVTTTYEETDPQVPARGRIGLQVHSGPPIEVRYRNLVLRELTAGD